MNHKVHQTAYVSHRCLRTDRWLQEYRNRTGKLFARGIPDGTQRVKIAVLDTGIDSTHPSIKETWRRCSLRKDGSPLLDRGYVDFHFDSRDEMVPEDTHGHGTHVAGIILDLAPDAELHVARVFRSDTIGGENDRGVFNRIAKVRGFCDQHPLAVRQKRLIMRQAIRYATDEWDVDIISMSFGFEKKHPKIYEAIKYAFNKDVVMLAAASNDGKNPVLPIAYPARQLGMVICINSADASGNKSRYNPPAEASCDNFSILGENVSSTWPSGSSQYPNTQGDGGNRKRLSGTSVATPIAASVAILIMQYKRLYTDQIQGHRDLESYSGIRQIFARMTLDKSSKGGSFDYIRPWAVLDFETSNMISGTFTGELKKL